MKVVRPDVVFFWFRNGQTAPHASAGGGRWSADLDVISHVGGWSDVSTPALPLLICALSMSGAPRSARHAATRGWGLGPGAVWVAWLDLLVLWSRHRQVRDHTPSSRADGLLLFISWSWT